MEGNTQFPEFEKLLEERNSSVYPEEFQHVSRIFLGSIMIAFGILPFLLFFLDVNLGVVVPLGVIISLIGLILFFRESLLFRSQRRTYDYRGMSRRTISDALMYIEAYSLNPDELELPPPYHGMSKKASYVSGVSREELSKFLVNTIGLIVWPSEFIDAFEIELSDMKKRVLYATSFKSILVLVFIIASYYLITSLSAGILTIGLFFIFFGFRYAFAIPRFLYTSRHLLKTDWLNEIPQSHSIQLEDLLNSIFRMLKDEYQYPLRFHFWREYPLLKYTGRTELCPPTLQLKEAVLYPTPTH